MTAKERPISFKAPMVQAILDDRKTMTRRVINKLTRFGRITEFSKSDTPGYDFCFRDREMRCHDMTRARVLECCPYGVPGDVLWVRENGWERPYRTPAMMREGADTWPPYIYDADGFDKDELKRQGWKRRPSIHMPRKHSRLSLLNMGVRIERLQDISQGDAQQEGPKRCPSALRYWFNPGLDGLHDSARQAFTALWNEINGPGAWDANPFVWVISFRRIEQ